MTVRYFKASDGVFTVFRATASRTYTSARIATNAGSPQTPRVVSIGFSSKPAVAGFDYPVLEITKAEYEALAARKTERLKASGAPARLGGSPNQAWVRDLHEDENSRLAGAARLLARGDR
jgi:hypothetical protein